METEGNRENGTPASLDNTTQSGLLTARGDWVVGCLEAVDQELRSGSEAARSIDISGIGRLDTAGAWILVRASGGQADAIKGVGDNQRTLLEAVAKHRPDPVEAIKHRNSVLAAIARLGAALDDAAKLAIELLGFAGLMLSVAWDTIRGRRRLRINSVVHNIEAAGLDAVPIIALISFLVGAVISFMTADTLQDYGGAIFSVDLIAITFLREFGVLLAAIMIAGRSGSAYTAEIGAMKGHEEIDAMRTLALDPIEILVIPRMVALLVSVPLLTFISDIMGLFAGAIVSWTVLDLGPQSFINRLNEATGADNFFVGMVKAPFFAFLIAMIGCFQGFKVTGTAESVGQRTTLSVVQSIFVVIVFDALFALFFMMIDY